MHFDYNRDAMKYILLVIMLVISSASIAQDNRLTGTWDNGEGQRFVFSENNKALWIIYDEHERDTFDITYTTDFSATPLRLDLSGFVAGPLKGKTLFGIVEYQDERTIRFDCEQGTSDAVRPKVFNPKQTQTFKRK